MKSHQTGEERRAARVEYLRTVAEKREAEADRLVGQALEVLPENGQPVLVGHHSEGWHRRRLRRSDAMMSRAVEARRAAERATEAARTVENRPDISCDDADALEQLDARIASLQAEQERDKRINKLVRKGDREGLAAMGLSEEDIHLLFVPDFGGDLGVPGYRLRNRAANIRRLKQRRAELARLAETPGSEETVGRITIMDNAEANRIQIEFPGKPAPEIRARLKAYGFRWAPSLGVWQRNRSSVALQYAREIAREVEHD